MSKMEIDNISLDTTHMKNMKELLTKACVRDIEFDTYISEVVEATLNKFGPEGAMRLSSILKDAAEVDPFDNTCRVCGRTLRNVKYPYECINCGKVFHNVHPLVTCNQTSQGVWHKEIFCRPACEDCDRNEKA